MSSLLIVGAGGHGRVVADVASHSYSRIAFLDDAFEELQHIDWPVLGSPAELTDVAGDFSDIVIGIGNNAKRQSATDVVQQAGHRLAVIVDNSAAVSARAKLGDGTVVMPQAAVNAAAELGHSCIVNTGATVDHDCRLGDCVHVSPGANLAGGVSVGARAWIGIGAAVRDGVTIGADAVIGAGAAVVADVAAGCVVYGVPARRAE